MAAEKVFGREWYNAVGNHSLLGATKLGNRRRFCSRPLGECEIGVRSNLVRTISRGSRKRPVRQLEMPITMREPIGLGLSVKSIPLKPAARGVVRPGERPECGGPGISGRPRMARRRERMKESVVRRRMEYRNVVLLARQSPTAPDVA